MPLSHTNGLAETSANAFGAGAFTTGGFTPGIGKKLLVIVLAMSQADDALQGSDLTITDSMGPLTWTSAVSTVTADSIGWGYASRAWVSSDTTTGASMTVTIDAGAFAIENYRVIVEVLTDAHSSPIGATGKNTDADGDGAASVTLSAAALATSIVFGALLRSNNTGIASAVTPGTGWTEESETLRNDWWAFQIQYRTNYTGSTADWDDLDVGPNSTGAQMIAVEILEILQTPVVLAWING